ncbi:MAG: endonuclease domain-containing protein [Desulfobacterales bacterium]|nr:endonuclease domain-containing protein [Desulfobacterales bacterium]
MLLYNDTLKQHARRLRKNMTNSEQVLWSRLRGKQLLGVQFYRQKPIGDYIVDFYAPKTKLVIEVDGSQHREDVHASKDKRRDTYLASLDLRVLRFNSRQVLQETDAVVEVIFRTMAKWLNLRNPP